MRTVIWSCGDSLGRTPPRAAVDQEGERARRSVAGSRHLQVRIAALLLDWNLIRIAYGIPPRGKAAVINPSPRTRQRGR
jgi:hypothetical protein